MGAYKVIIPFNSPRKGASGNVEFKSYAVGSLFIGEIDEANKPPLVRGTDGYVIPKANVYPANEAEQYSSPASSAAATKLPADVQDSLDKTIKKDFIGDITELSKGATSGAMIGAVVGIIVGLYYQKSLLVTGFAGLVVGGLVGRNYNKSKALEITEASAITE